MNLPKKLQPPPLDIRRMTLDDLDAVLEIERQSFRTPWTPDMFVTEFENPRSVKWVARRRAGGRAAGFMIYWIILDECHLMNLAVPPPLKRRGIAACLIEAMLADCRKREVRTVSLEVRVGNEAAIGLYTKFGFKPCGLRKNYYQDEGEDAVLMELELT